MPLTSKQKNAIAEARAYLTLVSLTSGTAESVEQRARLPHPAHIPADLIASVEIAPPVLHPLPLLDSAILKAPERVPVCLYSLRNAHAKSEVADTHVIFFIHGGGNVMGHPTDEPLISLFTQLLRAVATHSGDAKCVVVAPSYRLATVPENSFPAGMQDVVAAYDYVIGKGYKASNIVIAGDSAGGNNAVVLTHLIMQSRRPSPRGITAIAPGVVRVYNHLSEKPQASTDILSISFCEKCASAYVGDSGVSPTDPLISGGFIPFTSSWPKVQILVGTGDLLIDGSRELAKRLLAVDVPVELVEYDELPHGWWVMSQIFPEEVQDAVQRIARFTLARPLDSN